MSERYVVWAAVAAFYAVAVGLVAFIGWLAVGPAGAILTILAAVAAAVWAVTGRAA